MTSLREEAALSDFGNAHRRKHNEYTYRLPTAPRIIVPPPTLTTDMPGLMVGASPTGEVDLSFLRELDLQDIIQKNTLLEWAYERRRQAQMMLPWLYLGPMVAAKDQAFLAREGITMVLAIRAQNNSMSGALRVSREVCAEVATIETPTFHELIGRFGDTTRMINTHIARVRQHSLQTTGQATLGKVLVFCESGNEKSAAVVAAYLMDTLNDFDHVKAMQVCQAQRFCVNFDDTLKNILQSYWDILQARRSVASLNANSVQMNGSVNGGYLQAPVSSKQKRSIENTHDDDDMDMDSGVDPSDALRFVGRDSTPFQNRDA
jgi:serine/threonine/tyrosine-interacting protein